MILIFLIGADETFLSEEKEVELVTKLREKYHPQLSPVSYTGVFLDEESRKKLLAKFFGTFSILLAHILTDGSPGWSPYADHMTIKLGAVSSDDQRLFDVPIGKKVRVSEENEPLR